MSKRLTSRPARALALLIGCAAGALLLWTSGPFLFVLVVVVGASCFYAGMVSAPPQSLLAIFALMVTIQVAVGFSDFPNVEIVLYTLAPWWAGDELRRKRAMVSELAEKLHALEQTEAEYVAASVRRERTLIARDLHDVVGHHLAVVAVQAGAGRTEVAAGKPIDRERFRTIRAASEQALVDMTRLVDFLGPARRSDLGFARLEALRENALAGGVSLNVAPLPEASAVTIDQQNVIMDVVTECLTNTIKYAPGADAWLTVVAHDGALTVEFADSGPHAVSEEPSPVGGGHGLAGMEERVRAAEGEFSAGPDGTGWLVRASLPAVPVIPGGDRSALPRRTAQNALDG